MSVAFLQRVSLARGASLAMLHIPTGDAQGAPAHGVLSNRERRTHRGPHAPVDLEKARFPEAVVAFPQGVGLDSPDDNVIQKVDFQRLRRFAE